MANTGSNTSKRAKAAASAVKDLEARLAELRGEIDDVLTELAERTGKKVSEAADEVADEGETLLDDLRDTVRELKRKAIDAEHTVVDATRDRPVQSLLMAFGVGFLVSALMRR